MKVVIILFSFLLSLGLLAEKYFPFGKELLIVIIFLWIFLHKEALSVFRAKFITAWPLFMIFLLYVVIGGVTSYYFEGESVINIKFLSAILIFIILSTIFSLNPLYIKYTLVFFGLGAGLLSILYSFDFFGAESFEIRGDRLYLLNENPNSLSVRISLGVLFLVWGSIENVLKLSKISRYLLLVPIPFMFNLVLASGSKGSFIICIISPLIYILLLKTISKTVKISIMFLSAIILLFTVGVFLDSALYLRFLGDDLSSGRSEIWEAAFDIFLNNPMGVGEIGYLVEISKYMDRTIDTHNLFIYLLVTGGLLALCLFLIFLIRVTKNVIYEYKHSKNIINVIILISSVFIMSKTGGVLTYLIMWYFLACVDIRSFNKVQK